MERDEIYLIDMWRLFVREWRWFVAMLVLALALTFAVTHLLKRQWEATAWIQIGQVSQAPQGQDVKVEPLQRVLERLQFVPFQDAVLQRVGIDTRSPEAGLYRKSMRLDPLPYAGPLVRMSVRAHSRELARQLADATVAQLHTVHAQMEEAPLALARARLAEVQGQLQSAEAERRQLMQAAAPTGKGDSGSPAPLLSGVLLASKNDDIHTLQQARSDLMVRLSANYTYETSLMWPVYAPEGPVFPNLALMWGVGTLAGLCLGAFAAVTRNALRRSAFRRSTLGQVISQASARDRHSTKAAEDGTHA